MARKEIKIGPPGTPFERTIYVPDLNEEFYQAVKTFPVRAAGLWATVMEASVRSATVDFSWKDPLDPEGKKVFKDSHSVQTGFLDGGQKLADRIAALGKKMVNAKILKAEDGFKAIEELDRLTAEVDKFLQENPGKDEGASWVFALDTPQKDRLARISEMPLPEGRRFLQALFDEPMKIIETVDINLKKPAHRETHRQFLQYALAELYGTGSEAGPVVAMPLSMPLPPPPVQPPPPGPHLSL